MKSALMVAFVLAAVACGGKAKPDSASQSPDTSQGDPKPAPDGTEGMGHAAAGPGHEGHKEMMAMPPQIAKFHDTLAPRWHAERGAQRTADTCAAIGQLQTEAEAIVAAPAPAGANASDWSAGGKQLVDAVVALDATCKAKDAAAFEPAFERLHTSFHHVMEAAGKHHGEHRGH